MLAPLFALSTLSVDVEIISKVPPIVHSFETRSWYYVITGLDIRKEIFSF